MAKFYTGNTWLKVQAVPLVDFRVWKQLESRGWIHRRATRNSQM